MSKGKGYRAKLRRRRLKKKLKKMRVRVEIIEHKKPKNIFQKILSWLDNALDFLAKENRPTR